MSSVCYGLFQAQTARWRALHFVGKCPFNISVSLPIRPSSDCPMSLMSLYSCSMLIWCSSSSSLYPLRKVTKINYHSSYSEDRCKKIFIHFQIFQVLGLMVTGRLTETQPRDVFTAAQPFTVKLGLKHTTPGRQRHTAVLTQPPAGLSLSPAALFSAPALPPPLQD